MDTYNVLVIEDDEIVARTIERILRGNEFHVILANSGVEGQKIARRQATDLVILDIMMPGMDGYTVCQQMRADPLLCDLPILFLTAKVKDDDKIKGFLAGCDDYMTKPFNIDELVLRVRAILRRARKRAALHQMSLPGNGSHANGDSIKKVNEKNEREERHHLTVGGYILNARTYELSTPFRGKVRLTPVQFDLLYYLMSHPGEIFPPPRLLDEIWDYPSDAGSPDLVRVHIKNLRERIEEDPHNPKFILTVSGYGYTISAESVG